VSVMASSRLKPVPLIDRVHSVGPALAGKASGMGGVFSLS
jgi:hypothetical protein